MNYHQRLMKIENRIKTDRMKKVLLSFVLAVMAVAGYAQTQMNLVGREYHCDNMLTGEFKAAVVEAKEKAIKEKEQRMGRKLSDTEKKELDSEIKQNQAELNAIKEGTKMSMTFYYTIKGHLLTYTDEDGERDTLRISPDCKYIYGTLRDKDKKEYKYTLTRTK